ncbi:MAG: thioesterase family protein [Alteromonadaceae bacterium]|nr:thioesterase family protein [Alteromonadaceae bacterium]
MKNNIIDKKVILNQVSEMWSQVPFNNLLGIYITKFDHQEAEIRFKWQDKLIGNHVQKILHGGVTATALDFAGGVVAAANIIENLEELNIEKLTTSLNKLGTIDLRTDYLRPGRGEEFIVTAKIIRSGSKVAVARMEMHNEKGEHLAFGTGTYMVG